MCVAMSSEQQQPPPSSSPFVSWNFCDYLPFASICPHRHAHYTEMVIFCSKTSALQFQKESCTLIGLKNELKVWIPNAEKKLLFQKPFSFASMIQKPGSFIKAQDGVKISNLLLWVNCSFDGRFLFVEFVFKYLIPRFLLKLNKFCLFRAIRATCRQSIHSFARQLCGLDLNFVRRF